jgi:hypothetical protein
MKQTPKQARAAPDPDSRKEHKREQKAAYAREYPTRGAGKPYQGKKRNQGRKR